MDSYTKLINELDELIKQIQSKIDYYNQAITNKNGLIRGYETQQSQFTNNLNRKKEDKRIFENYSSIIKGIRKKHIIKFLIKAGIIGLEILLFTLLIQNPLVQKIFNVIIAISSGAVVLKELDIYFKDIENPQEIYFKYLNPSYDLTKNIEDLELAIEQIQTKINEILNEQEEYKMIVTELSVKRNALISSKNKIEDKRTLQAEQLIQDNEETLNLSFASDKDVLEILKLERSLKNGKNI